MMTTDKLRLLRWPNHLAVLSLILTPLGFPAAQAQQQTALEEVVVTAQKREEALLDAPLAVTALSSEQLDRLGISSLGDLAQGAVPTLKVQPYPNSPATLILSIRGVGVADAGSVTTEIPVGIYVDGVYIGRSQGLGADILDLERLEILRGPQGSLYGRNTIGGAVNFITRKPSGEFGFKQKLSVGSDWGYYRSLTQVDLPAAEVLGGRLSARISYLLSDDDGWVENAGNGTNFQNYWSDSRDGGRLALRWEGDTVAVDYSYEDSTTEVGQAWFQLRQSPDGTVTPLNDGFRLGTVGFPIANVLDFVTMTDQNGDPNPGFLNTPAQVEAWRTAANEGGGRQERTPYPVHNIPTVVDTESHALTVSWDYSESLQLKSITSYREVSQDTTTAYAGAFGLGLTNLPNQGEIDPRQWSQEFQAIGEALDGRARYVAGVYQYEEDMSPNRQGQQRTNYVSIERCSGSSGGGQGDVGRSGGGR